MTAPAPRHATPTRAAAPRVQKRPYRMRARAHAAAATRERILSAAWQHFAERPYDDVRLADVAAEAGVTVQTLHAGFGRKQELFVAAWQWFAIDVRTHREGARVGDVREAVRLLYDTYEQWGDATLRALAQEDRIAAVRQMTDSGRDYHRGWVQRTFAPLLGGLRGAARERRLSVLILATDVLAWKLLRRDMQHPRARAEQIVLDMITATNGAP
jgi:AcrR family transcriptional regulator